MGSNYTSLQDFYDMLEKHDWYFVYSDDMHKYERGLSNESRLVEIAAQTKAHEELYQSFNNHMYSGSAWNTSKATKPERPSDA